MKKSFGHSSLKTRISWLRKTNSMVSMTSESVSNTSSKKSLIKVETLKKDDEEHPELNFQRMITYLDIETAVEKRNSRVHINKMNSPRKPGRGDITHSRRRPLEQQNSIKRVKTLKHNEIQIPQQLKDLIINSALNPDDP